MPFAFIQPASTRCVSFKKRRNAFICPFSSTSSNTTTILRAPNTERRRSVAIINIVCTATGGGNEERLELPVKVRNFAALGSIALTCALINRVFNTAVLTAYQSRADIIAVVCGVSLLVYAAGSTEVKERGTRVEQEGTYVEEFEAKNLSTDIDIEARFVARAAMAAVVNITSVTIFRGTQCVARQGLYRAGMKLEDVVAGETVRSTITGGKLAYFADLKVMPTKEIELAYLPKQCQAIIVVPIAGPRGGAVVFGADKVRPLTGKDFGWLTALCNRLEDDV